MARSARALALLVLALLPLAIAPAQAALPPGAATVGPGDIYLALGDSLPVGYEVVDDGQPGFPVRLHADLLKLRPGIALANQGVVGETSSTMISGGQLAQAEAFILAQRAAGKLVSPVTLSIGGNDAAGVILPGSTATLTDALTLYRANLVLILDTLLGALSAGGAPTGDLIIQNYYNPYPGLAADARYALLIGAVDPDRDLPRFNQVIGEEAAARGIAVADVYTPFLGREKLYTFVQIPYPDPGEVQNPGALAVAFDFHPRPLGHQAIAAAFLEASGYLPKVYLPLAGR